MDPDALMRFCESVDEERRFGFYKRIADLCLFILGVFPEYVTTDLTHSPSGQKRRLPLRRMRRSLQDYEEEGKMFYRLAGEHENAMILGLTETLTELHERFNLARKPLTYLSEHYLPFRKQKLFPSPSTR